MTEKEEYSSTAIGIEYIKTIYGSMCILSCYEDVIKYKVTCLNKKKNVYNVLQIQV